MKHKIRKWNEEKKANDIVEVNITTQKAIHYFCVNECMAGQSRLVPGCTDPHCPLYPYRMGKNPEIQKDAERIQKATKQIMEFNRKRKNEALC